MLQPTKSGLENTYNAYIQLDISSAGVVTENATTEVLFSLDLYTKSGTDPITYVITLAGGTVESLTVVESSLQSIDWSKDTVNNKITIVANSGHGDFTIYVKNYKET